MSSRTKRPGSIPGRDPRGAWRARAAAFLIAALALTGAARTADAGLTRPSLKGAVGMTGAISGTEPRDGGLSLGIAGLWPIDERLFSAGVMLLADDMGSQTGPLRDPNSGVPLGTTEILHRAVYGVAFRVDATPPARKGWGWLGSGTWGAYQVVDDVRGDVSGVEYGTGFSLAAGVRYGLRTTSALAGVVRYHRVFDERVGRYMSFGAEFTWW